MSLRDELYPDTFIKNLNDLKKCPSCKKEISVIAPQCPNCGRPKPFRAIEINECNADCIQCKGTGKTIIQKDSTRHHLNCSMCHGAKYILAKEIEWEENNDPYLLIIT